MQLAAVQLRTPAAAAAGGGAWRGPSPRGTASCAPRLTLGRNGAGLRARAQAGGESGSEEDSAQEELDQQLRKVGPAAADLDPLEGHHCEPPPADGEGPEWNMGDFTHHEELSRQSKGSTGGSEGGGASPASARGPDAPDMMGAGGAAKAVGAVVGEGGATQDGHYHYTAGDYGSGDQQKINESWMCEEEPEALERSATAKHEPPHFEMYRGEADDSEGFKEPGQSIASALPRMGGEAEDFIFWNDDGESKEQPS